MSALQSVIQQMSGGFLPYSFDPSALPDGALPAPWVGTTFTISGGKVANSPTLGAELLTNGDMETGDPPSNWTATSSATLDGVADERTGGTGAQSLSVTNGATALGAARQSMTHAADEWIVLTGWIKRQSGGTSCNLRLLTSGFGDIGYLTESGTDWTLKRVSGRVTTTNGIIAAYNGQNTLGNELRVDDVSAKVASLPTLFALLPQTVADVDISVDVTLDGASEPDQSAQAGVVLNVDSYVTPTNFVVGYYDRFNGRVKLDKCVAGTYTNLVNVAVALVNGAPVRVRKSGTTYQIFYNGVQRGVDQVIGDAGIISNTIHGMFSTGGSLTALDAFFCHASNMTPAGTDLVWQGTSIHEGGAATAHEKTSIRGLSNSYVLGNYPRWWWRYNYTRSGANSYNALGRFRGLIDGKKYPLFLPVDWSNDAGTDVHDQKSREAWIRSVWGTQPNCNLVVVIWPVVNGDGSITQTYSDHTHYKNLCAHYGVPVIDVHADIYNWVMVVGDPITTYYNYPTDYVHPLDAGHARAWTLLQAEIGDLLFGARQFGGTLPDYFYVGTDEYDQSGSYTDGTSYASKTGAWTESGGVLSSNSVGATVTYHGTFCSFGIEDESGSYPNCEYSVDGGAYVATTNTHHGHYVAARGEHDLTLKVTGGTLRIDKLILV